jgi:hypothetical protein
LRLGIPSPFLDLLPEHEIHLDAVDREAKAGYLSDADESSA